MSEAAAVGPYDDRSPLRRALDRYPHAQAIEIASRILDAADELARTGDATRLNDLVRLTIAVVALDDSPAFRESVARADAHPEPNPRPLPAGARTH